ncbi:MAG: hypothetical protein WCX46_02590 [Candidatus Paceibacterota bacterium]
MINETQKCQKCKKNFVIEQEDFNFYKKIKVPPPTFCPDCRLINRLINLSELTLYKDECDKCGEKIVSLFSPETKYPVYCNTCWWGDSWDAVDYGIDYDFNKSFFEQYYDLRKIVPCQATNIRNSIDCKYCNGIIRCKNCTYITSGMQSINCYYSQTPLFVKDSMDCNFAINADHSYEVVNSGGLYNTKFTYFSDECMDCSFIFNCLGCTNCFGCINLRNQKYCIFNKKYTKEEYEEEIKKWDLGSYKTIKKAEEKFLELYYKTPRRFALTLNATNVSGDDIQNSKNCKNCFSATHGVEDCKYIFHGGLLLKDSYDVTLGGDKSELLYQVTGSTECQRTFFSRACNNAVDVEYSENLYDCSNCFGCSKLRHKKYCILNKQYTKEEYLKLISLIKKQMDIVPFVDKNGIIYKYGDFYPFDHAMWAYNESWGHQWFPLNKEEAIKKGFIWHDNVERNYKITINTNDLPDHINDVPLNIIDDVIACEHSIWKSKDTCEVTCNEQCTTAFRILPNELSLYRSMKIALPRLCPNCRHYQRLKKNNPIKLWHRKCMCSGLCSEGGMYKNTIKHSHGDKLCSNEFETAINNERKEIVYCKDCYQIEFI